jgi:hypothetical protein
MDAYTFWLLLGVKMVASALLVVTATIAAERAGPFWGGLIGAFPVSAGPIYVALAFEHPPAFIHQGFLSSLVSLTPIALYMLMLALISSTGPAFVAVPVGLFTWAALSTALLRFDWTMPAAFTLYAVTIAACFWGTRSLRRRPPPRAGARAWYDIPLRALLVACLAACVTTFSHWAGPSVTGVAAIFPIVMTSIAIILSLRSGGSAVATIMAASFLPMLGFGIALAVAHTAAPTTGVWWAMLSGLVAQLVWSLLLIVQRPRSMTGRAS